MSGLPRATVAVVNWNGRALLETCLPSIAGLDYPRADLECLVVDNGSGDGSVEWLRAEHPAVRVVAHVENRGFAAAANDAAAAASGRIVAFLNNDCRVDALWLRRLVEALQSENAAAAGSCMLDWEGARFDFDGPAMNFHGHGSHRGWRRPYVADPARAAEPALFACGGAMAVDRDRFLATGGFDADYFAYFEDVDLGWRLWVEGERVLYVPTAVAFHRHRGSGMDAARWRMLLERNALASLFKNYEDDNLAVILPAARELVAARARMAVDAGAGARTAVDAAAPARTAVDEAEPYHAGLRAFDAALPALRIDRARVQSRRRRPDRDILPLFAEPFRPACFGRAYWETQLRVVRNHGLDRIFGRATVDAVHGLAEFVGELQDRIAELERGLSGRGEG